MMKNVRYSGSRVPWICLLRVLNTTNMATIRTRIPIAMYAISIVLQPHASRLRGGDKRFSGPNMGDTH
jgi:hypothetical protein